LSGMKQLGADAGLAGQGKVTGKVVDPVEAQDGAFLVDKAKGMADADTGDDEVLVQRHALARPGQKVQGGAVLNSDRGLAILTYPADLAAEAVDVLDGDPALLDIDIACVTAAGVGENELAAADLIELVLCAAQTARNGQAVVAGDGAWRAGIVRSGG